MGAISKEWSQLAWFLLGICYNSHMLTDGFRMEAGDLRVIRAPAGSGWNHDIVRYFS